MKTSEFKQYLEHYADHELRFILPDNDMVPIHAHITEAGRIDKTFVDCGGTVRKISNVTLQAWVADDIEHRLSPGKLAGVLTLPHPSSAAMTSKWKSNSELSQFRNFRPCRERRKKSPLVPPRIKASDCLAKDVCLPQASSGLRSGLLLEFSAMDKPLTLILCTGNSCRSHWRRACLRPLRGYYPRRQRGLEPVRLRSSAGDPGHPGNRNRYFVTSFKTFDSEFLDEPVSTVITVCGNADQACPMFPGQVNRYHWGFDDPAHATGTGAKNGSRFSAG